MLQRFYSTHSNMDRVTFGVYRYACVLYVFSLVTIVRCSHFMGATIRWKSDPAVANKVNLITRFNANVILYTFMKTSLNK